MHSLLSPDKVIAREREQSAMELRKAGQTYAMIGAALGVSDVAARKAVKRAVERLNRLTETDAQEVRRIELERIDALLKAVWPHATGKEPDYRAVEKATKLMERRAALLGIDAPKRIEGTGPAGEIVVRILGPGQSLDDV
jgi:hypothetical protein